MKLTGKKLSLIEATNLVLEELKRANKKFPMFNSKHEGYAILKEEVDELWNDIKNKNSTTSNIQSECIQVAAMALKFLTSDIYE